MWRPTELVNDADPIEGVARLHQRGGFAGEGHGVARHERDAWNAALGKLGHLRLGPCAGRVNDGRVELC